MCLYIYLFLLIQHSNILFFFLVYKRSLYNLLIKRKDGNVQNMRWYVNKLPPPLNLMVKQPKMVGKLVMSSLSASSATGGVRATVRYSSIQQFLFYVNKFPKLKSVKNFNLIWGSNLLAHSQNALKFKFCNRFLFFFCFVFNVKLALANNLANNSKLDDTSYQRPKVSSLFKKKKN